MDDSCAVCAETLEWVAYGPCGHKDVCSTCVARLRFICDDRRCCICKTESHLVFVTKALGDYTRSIADFSVFPSELREGRVGSYWYHEDTQAIFDDVDHYNMIKAMCRLSCCVCDKVDERATDGPKRKQKFRNVQQLKGHLFHQHKLSMCSLCLESRKVFICEQKLYTKAQLNQHIKSGDSEVDGRGSESGGFTGHPTCEFCRSPFYGDNELFSHMSTEHYTCHICQRQHPGQYDYFKNYDDLEVHFRREHFLCEDEACLAKKFVVFQFEAEMKRHNTMEHGGRMSRARRNAALQIPTSFRYRSGEQGGQHRGRGRTFRRDSSDNELSAAMQASLDASSSSSSTLHDPSSSIPYGPPLSQGEGNAADVDTVVQPFETLTTDSEKPARYLQAVSQHSSGVRLAESSFPPLPVGPSPVQNNLKNGSGSSMNTMAANLRWKNQLSVPNSAEPPLPSVGCSIHPKPMTGNAPLLASNAAQSKWGISNAASSNGGTSSSQAWPAIGVQPTSNSHSLSSQTWSRKNSKLVSARSPSPSKNPSTSKKITHSISAPSLSDNDSVSQFLSDFPPVSVVSAHKSPVRISEPPLPKIEDVSMANKALVEKMRAALAYDEEKYGAFKEISANYRQGLICTEEYLVYVEDFGLSHLVLDLARLCPDAHKQKELLDIHNANMRRNGTQISSSSTVQVTNGERRRKGKEKRDSLADSVISTVRELQSSYTPSEVEVLSKDGYRASKDKSETIVDKGSDTNGTFSQNQVISAVEAGGGFNQNSKSDGRSKQKKKNSKFIRNRLGEDREDVGLVTSSGNDGKEESSDVVPTRGVWQKGGSKKLFQ
uniref:RING-type E3 ubiquitin transferase n=1 Tax=Kalanchoe fedtschenkoi TaxID=63787 RepID=A0A7N1A7A1_KALFE